MPAGVAIAGAAECDLGRTGLPVLALQAQAITRALDDAGLALSDVDGIATNGVTRFSAVAVADYLGITPAWTDSTFAGGSAAIMYVARAADAIAAGHCRTVVVSFASNQRSARSRRLGGSHEAEALETQFEAPYFPLYPISYYAMAAQRYVERYPDGRAAMAQAAVVARQWALRNPVAWRHGDGPLSVEDVMSSAEVSSPLRQLDCCLVTDGGGAVVVTSLERARDLPRRPVAVLGSGEHTTNNSMTARDDLLQPGSEVSAQRAFAAAGLNLADVDVAEIYDSFTITLVLTLESLGLCPPGEAYGLLAGGYLAPGGRLPLNTTGGGLSYCHPGQLGVLLLVEAVRQLRGDAGDRQVPRAEVALVHGTGAIFSTHATVVLGTDR